MIYNVLSNSSEYHSEDRTIIEDNLLILFIICIFDNSKFEALLNQ